jgi:death-on-curing protein
VSTTRYLSLEHLLRLVELATGAEPLVRDLGAIASAAQRPRSEAFGQELYPSLLAKAAALLHSIAKFHPLLDGNKRFAWVAAAVFCEVNSAYVVATNDQAYDLTMAVATGQLSEVADIAKELEALVRLPAPDGDSDPA